MISTYAITRQVEQIRDKDGTIRNDKRWSNAVPVGTYGIKYTHKVINGVSFTIYTFPGSEPSLYLNYPFSSLIIAFADTEQELKDYAQTIGNHI